MRELEEDNELIGRAHPVDEDDILEEREDEERMVRAEMFDDDPFADDGDLDLDYEDEIYGTRT